MTHEQLEAIRKRTKKAKGNWFTNVNAMRNAGSVIYDDVPNLIAEVERLQAEIARKEGGSI